MEVKLTKEQEDFVKSMFSSLRLNNKNENYYHCPAVIREEQGKYYVLFGNEIPKDVQETLLKVR